MSWLSRKPAKPNMQQTEDGAWFDLDTSKKLWWSVGVGGLRRTENGVLVAQLFRGVQPFVYRQVTVDDAIKWMLGLGQGSAAERLFPDDYERVQADIQRHRL
jgi:hypothetical protein